MRIFRSAAVLALVACTISLPVAAQISSGELGSTGIGRRGRYSISGSVREADGDRPLESVEVKLWTLSAGGTATTVTGSNGNFNFSDVSSGTYYLVVEEQGYQRVQEEVNISGRPAIGVQLTLKRETPFDKVGDGVTVSTRELAIPRRAREAMERGLSLAHDKSDYKGSIVQFQRALQEYPDYYEAYMQMGLAYLKMSDAAKSEEMLLKSIDMSKRKYPDALFTLAFAYSNQKRFADAEPLAREAVKLSPTTWDTNLEMARALHGLDRSAEAEPFALAAERIHPDDPPIHLMLANIHLKLRNYTALVGDLDSYLQLSPNGPEANQARQMRQQVLDRMAGAPPSTP